MYLNRDGSIRGGYPHSQPAPQLSGLFDVIAAPFKAVAKVGGAVVKAAVKAAPRAAVGFVTGGPTGAAAGVASSLVGQISGGGGEASYIEQPPRGFRLVGALLRPATPATTAQGPTVSAMAGAVPVLLGVAALMYFTTRTPQRRRR